MESSISKMNKRHININISGERDRTWNVLWRLDFWKDVIILPWGKLGIQGHSIPQQSILAEAAWHALYSHRTGLAVSVDDSRESNKATIRNTDNIQHTKNKHKHGSVWNFRIHNEHRLSGTVWQNTVFVPLHCSKERLNTIMTQYLQIHDIK